MSICPMCEKKWSGWDSVSLETKIYFLRMGIKLSDKESRIVAALVTSKRTLSHIYLYDVLWGEDPNGGPETAESTLKVLVSRTRKKCAELPFGIKNVWGRGYEAINIESLSDFPQMHA